LDLIENCVKARGYKFLRLDGSTSTKKRQTLVDNFQKDDSYKAFLISTKAGGLGLNLTAANKVIIFDVNWNPSYDEQAQDRAFRIGQQRDVEVIRLVSQGTVEELMYARQLYKVHLKQQALGGKDKEEEAARLFRGVVGDKNRKGELFGIENLLKFKDGSFMDDIWSSRKGKKDDKHAAANEEDIANALSNAGGVDGILNMGGTDEAEVQMLEEAAASENRRMSKGVNHEDFLSKNRGGAAIDQDDEGFEEEMGGASQMNYAMYEEGGEEDESEEEEKKEEDEDEKKPAAKLSPIAEQRIKDDPDVEDVQPTRGTQSDVGVGIDSTSAASASPTPPPPAAAAAAAAAMASTQIKKEKKASSTNREVSRGEATGSSRSEGAALEATDEESPIAEVAPSILIIEEAKKASKKKYGSPSKLSGLLHKPSYDKKKKKRKKKDL